VYQNCQLVVDCGSEEPVAACKDGCENMRAAIKVSSTDDLIETPLPPPASQPLVIWKRKFCFSSFCENFRAKQSTF
jgi:hypothetical protein